MTGRRIAHYEILEKLGEGGMGVVYKARDLHLDRSIALKLLPPGRPADDERVRRFVQEAKAASALNHPNIITVHDIDFAGGSPFIAMEYVAGETLDRIIAKKPMDPGRALHFAIQVADALSKAHAAGIVHRDLKPSNVMVTEDGVVKVLDFGLAKLSEPDAGGDELTRTLRPNTGQGVILGTVSYMSPEQAQGHKVDFRSDVFSFGSMLYEMITGRKAFPGESDVSVLGAIIHKEPEPIAPATPPALDRIICRCLRKDPARRFQHMGDLKIELEEARENLSAGPVQPLEPAKRRRWLPWTIACALALLLAVAVIALWPAGKPASAGTVRFTIEVPQRGLGADLALSPDGKQLVYSALQDGKRQLFLRSMDRLAAQGIPGTDNGGGPAFSPDGQWLYFKDGKKLRRMRPSGAELSSVIDCEMLAHYVPLPGGGLIHGGSATGGNLVRVSETGGPPLPVTHRKQETGEYSHQFPFVLPGGKSVLFTALRAGLAFGKHHIAVTVPEASEHRIVLNDGYAAVYSPSGHLVFRRSGVLFAVPFDAGRLAVTRSPVPVADDLLWGLVGRGFAVSPSGTLAYIVRDPDAFRSGPVWVEEQGAVREIPAAGDAWFVPALSPDGTRLALSKMEGQAGDIWIWDFAREGFTRVTFEGNNHAAIWSPDGASIVFSSSREEPEANLWRAAADGSGKADRLTTSNNHQDPGSFSPDGKLLVYAEIDPALGTEDIFVLDMSSRKAAPFVHTKFGEHSPAVSPDGKWLAYTSNESGRPEIYVQEFPRGGGKHQVSNEGGEEALWRPDGREIFFRNGRDVMAAAVASGPGLQTGKPRLLFSGPFALRTAFGHPNWDISRDGKRFLMLNPVRASQEKPRQIRVVLNWFDELRTLAPAGKR